MATKKTTTTKTAVKKTTTRKAAAPKKTAAKTTKAALPTQAYIFFNCDEAKSAASMNLAYNSDVYADRKALLAKVQDEVKAGRVNVEEDKADELSAAILKGNPVEASQYMQYGAIHAMSLH